MYLLTKLARLNCALSANKDKRIKSIDSIEKYTYETGMIHKKKKKIRRILRRKKRRRKNKKFNFINIIKQYEK